MFYIRCWQLVFIHIYLLAIYLAFFSFLVIAKLYQPIHEPQIYFVFLRVGNPKTVMKEGCLGWNGGSSFVSRWFECTLVGACKCAYDCGLDSYDFF
ncbi:hypothetical protein CDL62_15140 [Alkalitalea saponilacus]|uniref:Uncharacterized protein n=1 Tax=Alkalitalea saponilacus TaxID=889453 RepID=A0A1T5HTZ4_9BACT|nr:hypothetical protein CDL62_15140 [Alkalitalea saponilacus]SKC24139.1 hypothetical protein SAMN03080601_03432 [Alkalitalea saponilacus]